MPSPTAAIGATLTAYVPDDTQQIALGYTAVRFYEAATQNGSYSLVGTVSLVAAQGDYSYNNTAALATDWFYWVPYGAGVGEGPISEKIRVGPPQATRKAIRQGVGTRLNLLEVVTATGSSATVFNAPELIDPDRSVYEVASRFARPTAGSYAGNTRRVRAGSTGYDAAAGNVTVARSFGGTLAAATEVELWAPRGSVDPSARIDEAINRARLQLWAEDTWYLTTDDSVTDYFGPGIMVKEAIKRIEWASDSYPSRPGWRPVGWWDLTYDSGQPLLTILYSAGGNAPMPAGKVVRVVYNRPGDRLEADADYVYAALEWAVAEAAYEYLNGQLTPESSKEQLANIAGATQALLAECMVMRATFMPGPPTPHVKVAR